MKSKHLLLTLLMALVVPWAAQAQETVTIGDGTSAGKNTPIGTYYNYSITEQLYTADEIGMAGTINSISFYYMGTAAKDLPITVYMMNTDAADLSTGISLADADQVFSGTLSVTTTAGWVTITLDEPFAYDGTSNLLIGVNKGYLYYYNGNTWQYTSASNMARYSENDDNAYDTSTVPSNVTANRPNIQIEITASGSGPTCTKPSTFEVSNITSTGADFTWENTGAASYTFEYKKNSDSEWTVVSGLTANTYNLTTLESNTAYNARVKAVCDTELESGYKTASFTTLEVCPDGKVCIGSGTSTNSSLPANNYYKYSLTEQIYTAEELGEAGAIMSVDFYKASTAGMSTDLDIYIVSTDKTKFESTSDWVSVTASDLVYSGTVTFADNDWTTIEFDNLFTYNGTSNIILVVDNNTGNYASTTPFYVFTASANQALYYQDDNTNLDPTTSITTAGTVTSSKNRVRFAIGEPPTCFKPQNLQATLTPGNGTVATLTWERNANGTEDAWVLEYGTASDFTGATSVNVTGGTPSKDLTGLTAEQTYYARVKADCGDGESEWSNTCEFKPTLVQTIEIEGTTAATSSYLPSNTNYDYSYTQQIYTAEEIGNAGLITSVAFKGNKSAVCTLDIYLANTTKSTFSGTSDYIAITDATLVFSGDVTFITNDWKTIDFDESFEYTGDNLAIIVDDNSGNYTYGSTTWQAFDATGQSLYFYQDNTDINPAAPSAGSSGTPNNKNQIHLGWLPNPYPKPAIASTTTDSPTATTITWTAPDAENTITGYAYQLKLSTDTDWGTETTVGATVLSAELITEPEKDYDFRVRAVYGENYSSYATTSFTSPGYCMTPTNLVISNVTDSEATLSWQEEFGAGHWMLGYKTTEETEYTYVDVNRAINYGTHTLESLTEQTTYDVVVYPVCDATKTLTGQFTTKCSATTVPAEGWTENFDSYTGVPSSYTPSTRYMPDCWSFINECTYSSYMYYPTVTSYSSSSYAYSTSNYLRLYSYYSSWTDYNPQPQYAILPQMDNLDGKQIVLWAKGYNASSTLKVGRMTDPEDASTFALIQELTLTTSYQEFEVELTGTGNYIALMIDAANSYRTGNGAYVDDITVENVPTCLKPSAVTKSNVTNHSATLSWTNGAEGQTAWQIAYKAGATFDPTDAEALATATVIDVTTNPYTFSMSLDAATTYYMYVRANCGGGDYSKWSKTVCSFTTAVAAPAPTSFTASNFSSTTADLTWTAPAGDFLSGYELYYVAATEAPEAPTAETEATVTVTLEEAPTTEAPYPLTGLTAETQYYIWVRANHGADGYSAWTALTGSSFTTTAACAAMDPVVSDITHYTATVSWDGESASGFTVKYRIPASLALDGLSADFEDGAMPTGWTIEGPGSWTVGTGDHQANTGAHGGIYNAKITHSNDGNETYLVTPNLDLSGQSGLSINLWYVNRSWSGDTDGFGVYYRIDGGAWNQIFATTEAHSTWTELNEELPADAYAANVQFGFKMTDGYGYGVAIDDITIGTPSVIPAGAWQTVSATASPANIEGLEAGTKYDLTVVPNCDETLASAIQQFTTLADNVKIFVTEGDWNEAGNWMDGLTPTLSDNAQLQANATITGLATAGNVTIASGKTLTIADGGQLQHNNSSTITATVKKNITGYGADNANTNNGYVLLASPFGKSIYQNNSDGTGLRNGTYDLYSWARTTALEWTNYGSSNSSSLYMSRGTGYLYANQEDTEITFAGSIYGSGSSYSAYVSYTAPTAGTTDFSDWNLLGNPFVCNAYLVDAATNGNALAFYKMNADGNGFEATTGTAIAPMEGVFYQATEAGNVYFTREMSATSTQPGTLNISLAQVVATRGAKGSTDNAIIRFGEGNTLGKFSFNENSAKVYIPQNGKDYAVVNAGNVGEMPVNFKANENGSYTLSFSNSEVTFSYLHLIDNMTGADVDLLATPSYTFDARYTDYASRFRLVFATGSSANGENFGFVNASGNLSIFGIEGTATLQVIDVTGRILSSETFSGSYERKLNAAPGVYMLRLINGNDVKVQKIVVR